MVRAETQVGHYEILEEIGRGAMAIVHRARDPYENRDAAVKTFLRPNGTSPERWEQFRRRLRRQVHLARRLTHPGIVAVYDFDDGGGAAAPFIAMEYVQGPTLHELIRKEGALDPGWALAVTDMLADALHAADQAGVVHPRFEPANVLVRATDGVAKITDFGAVRIPDERGVDGVRGTQSYLAPECIAGKAPDLRSELYTLSVVLYEMLCGKPPFDAKTAGLTRESIVAHAHRPITEQARDIAPAFDPFFERALAKRPEDRFRDVPGFRKALAAVRREQQAFKPGAAAPAPAVETVVPVVAEPAAPAADAAPAVGAAVAAERVIGSEPVGRDHSTLGRAVWWVASAIVLVAFAVAVFWAWRFDESATSAPPPIPRSAGQPSPIPESTPVFPPPVIVETAPAPEPPPAPSPEAPPAATEPAATKPVATKPVAARPTKPVVAAAPKVEAPPVDEPAPVVPTALAPTEDAWFGEVAPAPESARLDVTVKSSLRQGTLSLSIDGEEVYTAALSKDDKKMALAKEIPAGPHTIAVRVVNEAKSEEYEDFVTVELAPGDARTVKIVAGRALGRPLTIRVE